MMDEAKVKEVLDTMYDHAYVNIHEWGRITLDGDFSPEQLEALAFETRRLQTFQGT